MLAKANFFVSLLLFVIFARTANAFVDTPTIIPAHPRLGELVSVSIRYGVCDFFVDGEPGYPKISQKGNEVHLVLASVHYDDTSFCDLSSYTMTFPVGRFAAGAYTLQVDRHYESFSNPPDVTETLGVLPFVVGAADTVPALSWSACGMLLAGLLSGAWFAKRER
jgi:hypothetical protein